MEDGKTVDFITECKDCIFYSGEIFNSSSKECLFHDRISKYDRKNLVYKKPIRGLSANSIIVDEIVLPEVYSSPLLPLVNDSPIITTVCATKRINREKESMEEEIARVDAELTLRPTQIFLCKTMIEVVNRAFELNSYDPTLPGIFILLGWHPDISMLLAVNNSYKLMVPLDRLNIMGAIDDAVKNVKTTYYTVWDCKEFQAAHLQLFNKLVNTDLIGITCLQSEHLSFNGLTVNTLIHRLFHGNANMPIYEKIKEAAAYQNNTEAYYASYNTNSP